MSENLPVYIYDVGFKNLDHVVISESNRKKNVFKPHDEKYRNKDLD